MKTIRKIHLPGGESQLHYTLDNVELKGKKILILGSSSEIIAEEFINNGADLVELILEDYESLMNARLILENVNEVNPKMMDFEITDFDSNSFDIIYAQASISNNRRQKILKEIKRLLIDKGNLIVGEVVKLEKNVPQFVQDIFDDSDLEPLFKEEIRNYYLQKNFEIQDIIDYSITLKEYYSTNLQKLSEYIKELGEEEKSYYKKLINQISHQSKAYLRHGADKFIGFHTIVAKVNKR